jgi:bacterioferritin-associated ferredoxin
MRFFRQIGSEKRMDIAHIAQITTLNSNKTAKSLRIARRIACWRIQLRIVLICVNIQRMIICVCNNVNEAAIRRAVAEGHASYDALQFELGVGTCCGQCKHATHEVMAQCRGAHHTTVRERIEDVLRPALQTIRIQPA